MAKVKLEYRPTAKSRALSPGYRVGDTVTVDEDEARNLTRTGAWRRASKAEAASTSGKGKKAKGGKKSKTPASDAAPAAVAKEDSDG